MEGVIVRYPSIDQYCDSLSHPALFTNTLQDAGLVMGADGFADYSSGNFGVVFRLDTAAGPAALKCFTRGQWGRRLAYRRLENSLPHSPYLLGLRYLEGEVFVAPLSCDTLLGYPALLMDYVGGVTLSQCIDSCIQRGDIRTLRRLSDRFDRMALWLLDTDFAHGDIKPDNVMVVGDDLELKLVDYDGVFVPDMVGECQRECGTEGYQHPLRSSAVFDRHLDDYSLALVSVTLRVLAADIDVFCRFCSSAHQAIIDPLEAVSGTSQAMLYLRDCDIVDSRLLSVLSSASPQIDGLRAIIESSMIYSENAAQSPVVAALAVDLVAFEEGGKFGYRNTTGIVVVAAEYSTANDFAAGIGVVSLGGRYGAINPAGAVCVEFQWDRMWDFTEPVTSDLPLAMVCRGGRYGFVDSRGRVCVIVGYDYAAPFSEGFAVVAVEGKYGYINECGEVQGALEFEYARPVRSGVCRVDYGGQMHQLSTDQLLSVDIKAVDPDEPGVPDWAVRD